MHAQQWSSQWKSYCCSKIKKCSYSRKFRKGRATEDRIMPTGIKFGPEDRVGCNKLLTLRGGRRTVYAERRRRTRSGPSRPRGVRSVKGGSKSPQAGIRTHSGGDVMRPPLTHSLAFTHSTLRTSHFWVNKRPFMVLSMAENLFISVTKLQWSFATPPLSTHAGTRKLPRPLYSCNLETQRSSFM